MTEDIKELLKGKFKETKIVSRIELFDFYREFEPDLKETTFRWRIHDLTEKKIIAPLSKRLFFLGKKTHFCPRIDDEERITYNKVEKQFPYLKQCIWSTKAIIEFHMHLPFKFSTIIEVEKDAVASVFYFLKDNGQKDIYIQPSEKEMEYYVSDLYSSVIVQSLTTKSPTQKVGEVSTVTIEKMLVDLYCEKTVFIACQGSELVHIINTAYSKYIIDFTKLFSYAKRRGKENDLRKFLLDKTDIPAIVLND